MKFRRSYRGHGRHVYVIRKARRYMQDGLQEYDRGLHAEFVEGFFDSEAAQELLGWSEEERDLVDRFLQKHADWGHGLYFDQSMPSAAMDPQMTAPEMEGQVPPALQTQCIAFVATDGESQMCGKPTVAGSDDFCARHAQEFAAAS